MNKMRVLAWILIGAIAVVFVLMIIALFLQRLDIFLFGGGVLAALIIVGFVLKAARRSREEREKQSEDAGEN